MSKILCFIVAILLYLPINAIAENHTILVTASTGSFGRAISQGLASEGHNLILAGRNQAKLDNLKNELNLAFSDIIIETAIIDFSDTKTIEIAADKFARHIINGIVLIGPRPIISKDTIPSKEEWYRVFAETFVAPLEVVRAFEPTLQDQSGIVVISGNSSKNYLSNYPNTNVMRLAWSGEVKNLAHFLRSVKSV